MDEPEADVCRVCRMEGSMSRPLFHPCHCSGSIRYVHQECLIEWLRVSKKVIAYLHSIIFHILFLIFRAKQFNYFFLQNQPHFDRHFSSLFSNFLSSDVVEVFRVFREVCQVKNTLENRFGGSRWRVDFSTQNKLQPFYIKS